MSFLLCKWWFHFDKFLNNSEPTICVKEKCRKRILGKVVSQPKAAQMA